MLIKLVQFVNKTTAPLSSACTFTSFGVHENVKLQPTTIVAGGISHSRSPPWDVVQCDVVDTTLQEQDVMRDVQEAWQARPSGYPEGGIRDYSGEE